ncbi:MAG: DNA primase [Gemmatimonadota bacterium]|nr:DNA primase [Gemmatimonadota bacterium]MDQ8147041.1 DNA primase [Gemmatimonadota bacterium]MDQ8148619.1 DNA primase [Gemmatimonadota bacterium]MDQ8156702.1 DNA primase [Gemmatimonadota bacterium]MDQ8176311.1 DNA primase [Gemmatimonadota bacterium]
MIPDEIVQQVSDQADIVAIVSEHVRLKKTGAVWRGPCPFHQGKGPNFSVVPGKGYTCFVCGEKGSVFTFLQKRLGMTFVEAVKHVGAKAGIDVPEIERRKEGPDPREPMWELQATVGAYFERTLWEDAAGADARAYLASRDVPRALAETFGLGFAPRDPQAMRTHLATLGYTDDRLLGAGLLVAREETETVRPRFRERLTVPILDASGHTVGFGGRLIGPGEPKYLNSAESEIFQKGKLLFNLGRARHAIRKAEQAVLVEGYFDVIRLHSVGVEEVVAPMGTALTEGQAELLGRYTRQVVLFYDADGPGQKATFRAADVLLSKGFVVRVATLPEGEDPDTYARTQGAAAVTAVITGAMDVFDRKVQLLERAGWFGDLQRKRRALDRLLPTIRAASDPVTRDLYLARASAAAGIAREVLLAELHTVRRSSSVRAASGGETRARGEPAATGPGAPGVTGPVAAGPYRSIVEQASAEADLLRVALTQPVWMDRIIEEIGKLEEEAAAAEGDGGEVAGWDDAPGPGAAFRDDVFRALYLALLDLGPEAAPEVLAERLPPTAVRVYEELRSEPAAVVDARATVDGAVRKLRGRALDARVRALEQLLPLAEGGEKDALTLRIKRLAEEKRALGVPSWGSVRRR